MSTEDHELINTLENELEDLNLRRSEIFKELNLLRKKGNHLPPLLGSPTFSKVPNDPSEKIELFKKLFRCREDIYPKHWENNKTGKKGYSPVCSNEWIKGICEKPKIKCSDCKRQAYLPILDTLLLTMPITFKGKLVQYAGRIHREFENKSNVKIYDYFDQNNGMTVNMFKKRVSTYKKMEYQISSMGSKSSRLIHQRDMFSSFSFN